MTLLVFSDAREAETGGTASSRPGWTTDRGQDQSEQFHEILSQSKRRLGTWLSGIALTQLALGPAFNLYVSKSVFSLCPPIFIICNIGAVESYGLVQCHVNLCLFLFLGVLVLTSQDLVYFKFSFYG